MAQRLIEAAQAIEVGHHQLVLAGMGQTFAGAGDETLAVEQAGQPVLVRSSELGFGRDDAGGAQPLFQPDAAPDADAAATHAQAHGDFGAGLLDAQDVLGQRPVGRQGQGAHRRRRAFRRQRAKTQGARSAGQVQAVFFRFPEPQGHIGGA